jgi:hypothetical protein
MGGDKGKRGCRVALVCVCCLLSPSGCLASPLTLHFVDCTAFAQAPEVFQFAPVTYGLLVPRHHFFMGSSFF